MTHGTRSSAKETGQSIQIPLEIELFVKLFAKCRSPNDRDKQESIIDSLINKGVKFDFQDMMATIIERMNTNEYRIEDWIRRHESRQERKMARLMIRNMDADTVWNILKSYDSNEDSR